MGWRETLKVEPKNKNSFSIRKRSNSSKSPILKDQKIPFATFADIADRIETSKGTISKMPKCLHGLPCRFILVKDHRQICSRNQQPIFDLDACPIGKWFSIKHTGGGSQ
ncbi:hypothetical protein HRM2_17360 [Desulforapulum autotrophicum HRM2]|uniref:Uncharacterized protein n=1 Tax=Desulforapulum autotrophicum (strain ATCC 43914 / DSM 3382 / VKM B-1955 / HRM2) TaxID=177437 RepID=C0QB43_DESAH|nr:hypothetical protein HRM2_17360 [Desulforapulum autotrophicum HRM2]